MDDEERAASPLGRAPGNVAQASMTIHQIRVRPRRIMRDGIDQGQQRTYGIVAADRNDAVAEATRRFRVDLDIEYDYTSLRPIVIERLSDNVVQTREAPADAWWRRLFR